MEKFRNDYLNLKLSDNERLKKANEFIGKKKLMDYDNVFIPVWITGHWILLVINKKDARINVYDSGNTAYPDVMKYINSFLRFQGSQALKPWYHNTMPEIEDFYKNE